MWLRKKERGKERDLDLEELKVIFFGHLFSVL
jgi:hypothetical protein